MVVKDKGEEGLITFSLKRFSIWKGGGGDILREGSLRTVPSIFSTVTSCALRHLSISVRHIEYSTFKTFSADRHARQY